jgi:cellulose synthase/poly-beta-1,6-N-acetylglucosamine synthase-like glycosyltransferase
MEVLFWSTAALVVYAYAGYPILLAALRRLRPRVLESGSWKPSVTVIVAAYNEEKEIAKKLELLLDVAYPEDRLQLLVVSDHSTDRTHEIVEGFAARGVELLILPERGGKTAAQNYAVPQARGEILIFTDATTLFPPNMVEKLVESFVDPRVGCAGAQLVYQSEGGTAVGRGGGLYWRYETMVKRLESEINSLIGVSGALYAIRRELYQPIEPELISDFVIALDTFARGHVTVYAPEAIAYEKTLEEADREFKMRTRVIVRSINALVHRWRILNPFRYGLFAVQVFSHKVLRYLVPELLIVAFLASVWLAVQHPDRAGFYQVLVALQLLLYIGVPLAYAASKRLKINTRFLSAPFYFVHANAAAFWGLVSYLRGVRAVTWTTVR